MTILRRLCLGASLSIALTQSPLAAPSTECFPFERLDPALQIKARRALLVALDRESLFTLVGPIKPWSTFGKVVSVPAPSRHQKRVTSEELADLKSVLATFKCGDEIEGSVQLYSQGLDEVRFAEPYILRRSSMQRKLRENAAVFRRIGVTEEAPSLHELLYKIETTHRYDRFRGYGLLFGYPAVAVDFFVSAAEAQELTGEFVARQFVDVPTFESQTGKFVWAVPVGHRETEEELSIRRTAAAILERYRSLRTKWIDESNPFAPPNSLELIREWYDDGNGDLHPRNARF